LRCSIGQFDEEIYMHFGIDLPVAGEYADVQLLATLASEAEAAGWDGFFLYDQIASEAPKPLIDPWIALTTIALSTKRIRLGPLVTPLARRRPWKVARETVTLDQLSQGRMILGVGLGADRHEFDDLGEAADPQTRAAMLDEALDVLTGLWSGAAFSYSGQHYRVREARFLPPPMQTPRIPIWVGGIWPTHTPFRRAARWDGVFPHYRDSQGVRMLPLDELRSLLVFIRQLRTVERPFDVVLRNKAPSGDQAKDAAIAAAYAKAGLTWWLEGVEGRPRVDDVLRCIRQGPPV
jgi:alkanesulfonate monooxygenase SsuD/methylene tetrahydromethanopterin reductase-like flavin-dependent oxidoreductase (luciferase family)